MSSPRDFASIIRRFIQIDIRTVARLGEPIVRNGDTPTSNYRFDSIYGKDPYFRHKHPASILCMPISKLGGLLSQVLTYISALSRKFSRHSSIPPETTRSIAIAVCSGCCNYRESTDVSQYGGSQTSS